jgi:threonine dehydratase
MSTCAPEALTAVESAEMFDRWEAELVLDDVEGLLRQQLDLEAVAQQLVRHQPGDPVDMAQFERFSPLPWLRDFAQPHFYQQYTSDKRGAIARTPLQQLNLGEEAGAPNWLVLDKREDEMDFVRAFKARGAMFAVLDAVRSDPNTRVFTTGSAGNHALGLLHAVRVLNNALVTNGDVRVDDYGDVLEEDKYKLYEAHIYCSSKISQAKYERLVAGGAKVIDKYDNLEDAMSAADVAADGTGGAKFIHPFDNEAVMAGQATLGLELLFDLKDQGVDLLSDDIEVRVPVGGGGLFAGLATVWHWAKQQGLLNQSATLVACEMEKCDSAARELHGLQPLGAAIDTDTEGLATQRAGRKTLPVIEWNSAGGVQVVDKEYVVLAASMLSKAHGDETPEFAAVVSLAQLLQSAEQRDANQSYVRKVCVTLTTGGNVAPELLIKNSEQFSVHQEARVQAAAEELGHQALVLAYRNESRRALARAALLERREPQIVLSRGRPLYSEPGEQAAKQPMSYALNGGTLRQFV